MNKTKMIEKARRAIHRPTSNAIVKLSQGGGGKREYLDVVLRKPHIQACFTRLHGQKNWQFDCMMELNRHDEIRFE